MEGERGIGLRNSLVLPIFLFSVFKMDKGGLKMV